MFRKLVLILFFLFTNSVFAQYPDGTLIFSSKNGPVGRIAKRITGGDQYTHIAIVIDNIAYESDWPVYTSTPVSKYGKGRTVNDFYIPTFSYTKDQVNRMRMFAKSRMGQRYRLKNYFYPNSKKTSSGWCSVFVGRTLNSSGLFNFNERQYHEPQNIFNLISNRYSFSNRVYR